MRAPARFAQWVSENRYVDPRFGHIYRYHPRSNAHSIALCTEIWRDLMAACPVLRSHAESGRAICAIDVRYRWPSTGKVKTLDLAVGPPLELSAGTPSPQPVLRAALSDVYLSCEAKSVMTEHGKSKPRVYDELSSSHEIVHQGRQDAIATGITVVNIAPMFVSPLRQNSRKSVRVSHHKQPDAAEAMIRHLRGLPIRDVPGEVGFDAYATVVVDCDNQTDCTLVEAPPAPQPGDSDHYETFLGRISRAYAERFA